MKSSTAYLLSFLLLTHCAGGPTPGPDKQLTGEFGGAAVGAGSGAVTGFQVGAGTGPGALIGAGLGAVAGGIQGYAQDQSEDTLLALSAKTQHEREVARVHEILSEHYKQRLELHPTRDIYPADLFFFGDEVKLKRGAKALVTEIAHLTKERMPWSRIVVASYARANDERSGFARHLAERRSKEICNYMVRAGIEPRRLECRPVVVDAPVLIDPDDDPLRYNQAIEFIAADN